MDRRMATRRLAVGDVLVLIATVAVGLAGMRLWLRLRNLAYYDTLVFKMPAIGPVLASLTVATFLLQLFRSARGIRSAIRKPGVAAMCAGVVLLALHFSVNSLLYWTFGYGDPYLEHVYFEGFRFLMGLAGPTIATVWAVMLFSGRWRREENCLGHLGRTLAALWISAYIAENVLHYDTKIFGY
jgi:hypothetical protein